MERLPESLWLAERRIKTKSPAPPKSAQQELSIIMEAIAPARGHQPEGAQRGTPSHGRLQYLNAQVLSTPLLTRKRGRERHPPRSLPYPDKRLAAL